MPKRVENDAHDLALATPAKRDKAGMQPVVGKGAVGGHRAWSAGQGRADARPHGSRGHLACSASGLLWPHLRRFSLCHATSSPVGLIQSSAISFSYKYFAVNTAKGRLSSVRV